MITSELVSLAQSALSLTREVTTRWPSRLAGSQACLQCADFLHKQLAAFCDQAHSQEFRVRPAAFLGYIRLNILLYVLALLALYAQWAGLAAALASLSVLITVLEFFFYKEFVDWMYPRKTGKNVWGTIEPAGEAKQQIIVSAHHDSAHIFNLLEKDPTTYARKIVAGTLTQLAMLLLSWLLWGMELLHAQNALIYWSLTGILTLAALNLWPLWFFYSRQGTPGAGDNLACTALALEIGKHFARQKAAGNPLKHTRILIASWDAEECGLRGARAFVRQQREALQQVKTYNFNLECMYEHGHMSFLISDLNGFVPLSSEMAGQCSQIAAELGFEMGTSRFPFLGGGTDAAEFAKAGVEATTLIGMDWAIRDKKAAYHTSRDTVEAVDEEALRRSIAIGIAYISARDSMPVA